MFYTRSIKIVCKMEVKSRKKYKIFVAEYDLDSGIDSIARKKI